MNKSCENCVFYVEDLDCGMSNCNNTAGACETNSYENFKPKEKVNEIREVNICDLVTKYCKSDDCVGFNEPCPIVTLVEKDYIKRSDVRDMVENVNEHLKDYLHENGEKRTDNGKEILRLNDLMTKELLAKLKGDK